MERLKNNSGYVYASVLSIIPLFLWMSAMPLKLRFSSSYDLFTSFGQITSLVGLVLYSITLILSARLEAFENLFGGMNKVYKAHHVTGGIAFLFFMAHPVLLAIGRITISYGYTSQLFIPGDDWTINMGVTALLSLMVLLIVTYYMDLPYQIWRFTHKFMGVAFIFGVIHAFFIPSDIYRYAPLKYYMLFIVSLGILAYFYRTVLGRFFVRRVRFTVEKISKLKNNIVEIVLTDDEGHFNFQSGQFIFISFTDNLMGNEVHPFSISSAPSEKSVKLTVKSLGDFTNMLPDISAGGKAFVEGPYGRFSFGRYGGNQIWIAGGIGITPFMSMARMLNEELEDPIDLYYCLKDEDEAVYLDELANISSKVNKFRVIPVYSKINGRLTAEGIKNLSGELTDKEIFICGPPPMMMSFKRQLVKLGVKREKIHTEEFDLL